MNLELFKNSLHQLWSKPLVLTVQQHTSIIFSHPDSQPFLQLPLKTLSETPRHSEVVVLLALLVPHEAPVHVPGMFPHPGFDILSLLVSWALSGWEGWQLCLVGSSVAC